MVYTGPSFACATCKKRRVKCDGTRPFCKNCRKRKIACPGVLSPPPIRFEDETSTVIKLFHKTKNEGQNKKEKSHQYPDTVVLALGEDETFTSLCFFHHHYMTGDRGIQSSRGLFEHLIPYFQVTDTNSLLSVATAALTATMLAMWRGQDPDSMLSRKYNARAIRLLKDTVGTTNENESDVVLITIIALQFREALIAHRKLRQVDGSHQRGAYAVVTHRKSTGFRSPASKKLLQEVRSTMVSEAIRTRQPVSMDPVVWDDHDALPISPASDLDRIAIDLAQLQALYERYKTTLQLGFANGQKTLTTEDFGVMASFRRAAMTIDQRLQVWAVSQSSYFAPCRIPAHEVPESVRKAGLYGDFCNVYPSVQLAGVWHAYNSYRLILLKMTLSADQTIRDLHENSDHTVPSTHSDTWRETATETLQHCFDEISAAVPFHLGSRVGYGSIHDFSNTGHIEYPWPRPEKNPYECQQLSTKSGDSCTKYSNIVPLSADERKRQNIAMGGYNILGPLAFLLGLAGESLDMTGVQGDGALRLGSLLRQGHMSWLIGQWQRVLQLHRIGRRAGAGGAANHAVRPTSGVRKRNLEGELESEVAAVKKAMELSFGV